MHNVMDLLFDPLSFGEETINQKTHIILFKIINGFRIRGGRVLALPDWHPFYRLVSLGAILDKCSSSLLLGLCLGITSGRVQVTIYGAMTRTQVSHMQSKHPICSATSPALTFLTFSV